MTILPFYTLQDEWLEQYYRFKNLITGYTKVVATTFFTLAFIFIWSWFETIYTLFLIFCEVVALIFFWVKLFIKKIRYANKRNKNLAFKNNVPFIVCISKINDVKTDDAEDLDVVMSMYNFLEYSKNYRKTTGSLWNYYRDEPSNPLSLNSESFKYKTSIVGKTPENNDSLANAKVVIPLKHLSNFWRPFYIYHWLIVK